MSTARVTPVEQRKVSASRLGRPYRIERPGLSPEAWPDAEPWGPAVSLARAAVGRREASALRRARPALRARVKTTRLSAFRFPFVRGLGRAQGNPGKGAGGEAVKDMVEAKYSGANKKSRRENGSACAHLSPRAGRGRDCERQRSNPGEGAVPQCRAAKLRCAATPPHPDLLPARGEKEESDDTEWP